MPDFKGKKQRPKIEEVTRDFGKAHAEEADAKRRMEKNRKLFFELIQIPEEELAQQTIFYEGSDPDQYVAVFYPKWQIIKKEVTHLDDYGEWRLLLREDPNKKSYTFLNPLDGKVYTRTVAEAAPNLDYVRIQEADPVLWEAITVEPPVPARILKPLDEFTEEQKEAIKPYFLPITLQNRMEKPREPKPEEIPAEWDAGWPPQEGL